MRVTHVSYDALTVAREEAAAGIGASCFSQSSDPRRFTIRPLKGCQYRRVSASYFRRGRRVHAVCWHGHRDFFRALFARLPGARVTTAFARYTAENFEATYPETAGRNIGPPIAPVAACEACDCPESGRGE